VEYAMRLKMKAERSTELRVEIERKTHEDKKRLVLTDDDANRRLARILEEREIKAQKARTLSSDDAQRTIRKFEEWQSVQNQKRQEVEEGFTKHEANILRVREDQQKQQLLRTIASRLKQDERDSNARHQENLRKRKIRVMRERQDAEDARLDRQKEEKKKVQAIRIVEVAKMEDQRAAFEADFKATLHQTDRSEDALRKLAKRFNMDIEELKAKVIKRPGTAFGRSLPGLRSPSQYSVRSAETAPRPTTTYRLKDKGGSPDTVRTELSEPSSPLVETGSALREEPGETGDEAQQTGISVDESTDEARPEIHETADTPERDTPPEGAQKDQTDGAQPEREANGDPPANEAMPAEGDPGPTEAGDPGKADAAEPPQAEISKVDSVDQPAQTD
jgi:hypothetical protein